ncbi:molybdopterin-guanine dinucleotide biosynthesis protein B [Bacillus sp. M6-12]|uniref:molybdopterin-guanine dinucleotide biosynthesis protein B n=1 Tax=Bacillus sp. M6-12 TaxID=2054166 RepID=UPI0015E14BCD|nr:molybdopterin-guanine dinucleotide biosynthesis protein B [Bacillus sp. M6-12]
MVAPLLFQIVGFQNTGKTTVISKLIRELDFSGLKTAVLKHHGHGGEPDAEEQKDSVKHFRSGAIVSMAEGEEALHLLGRLEQSDKIDAMLALLSFFKPELILIEGYKHLSYPKAILLKGPDDFVLADELKNIKVLLCWPAVMDKAKRKNYDIPIFNIDDNSFFDWFVLNYQNITIPVKRKY